MCVWGGANMWSRHIVLKIRKKKKKEDQTKNKKLPRALDCSFCSMCDRQIYVHDSECNNLEVRKKSFLALFAL